MTEPIKERLKKHSLLNKETGCIEWTGSLTENGYGMISRLEEGKHRTRRTHRVVYEEYIGVIPEGMCVCHRCDNRKCINPEHLFVGTRADNNADRERKGRGQRGERSGSAKLTEEKVISIRRSYKSGATQLKLADDFGVSQTAIWKIVNRKMWRREI